MQRGGPDTPSDTCLISPATALATALKLDIFTINPGQRGCVYFQHLFGLADTYASSMDDSKLRRLLGIPRRAIILIEDM